MQNALYILEGPTDLAAALTLGLSAIGRPSCNGCEEMVAHVIRSLGFRRAVLIADCDDPGQRGAEKLQAALSVPSVIYYPPADDLRSAVRAGLTAEMIDSTTNSMVWSQPQRRTNEDHEQSLHATHDRSL